MAEEERKQQPGFMGSDADMRVVSFDQKPD